LENPADFPKPVFIWKGSCRDTPQLIYITVSHTEKASRTNSTFGFLPKRKPTLKKPKELFFLPTLKN